MQNSKIIPALQNPEFLNEESLRQIIAESKRLAAEAAIAKEKHVGGDWSACGFAWVEIRGIKENTKLGRMLKKVGIEQDYNRAFYIWNPNEENTQLKKVGIREGYNRAFYIWNPGGLPVQSALIREAGANACAKYLHSKGFETYSCSRIDQTRLIPPRFF